jgi:hypothetical protein
MDALYTAPVPGISTVSQLVNPHDELPLPGVVHGRLHIAAALFIGRGIQERSFLE